MSKCVKMGLYFLFRLWDKYLLGISPIINEMTEHTLLSHSDAYPTYHWKSHTQNDKNQ